MATYVTLYTFTDQGVKNIKDTVKRVKPPRRLRRRPDNDQGNRLDAGAVRLGRDLGSA